MWLIIHDEIDPEAVAEQLGETQHWKPYANDITVKPIV